METYVGSLWHRFIARAADRTHPQSCVAFANVEPFAAVLFRAYGGSAALRIVAAGSTRSRARRRWLDRLSGTATRTTHAALDADTLQLPPSISLFADPELNRDLYLWLIALAGAHVRGESRILTGAGAATDARTQWLVDNQAATVKVLANFPGLRARYLRLVEAHIATRIPPQRLPFFEAAAEQTVRAALRCPGSVRQLPELLRPPQSVPLWLQPCAEHEVIKADCACCESTERLPAAASAQCAPQRQRGERVTEREGNDGILLPFRAESLYSWTEYLQVHRPHDEDTDGAACTDDMDTVSITRASDGIAARVRFDLDLPSAEQDETPLGPGLLLPEWDWRAVQMRQEYVRLQPMRALDAQPSDLPEHLRMHALRLRRQFSTLQPQRERRRGQYVGRDIDIDAVVRFRAERECGVRLPEPGVYIDTKRASRDLACLIMADLSLSTDSWIGNSHRVIDVVRDSLLLLGEALATTGDAYAVYGFSSLKRNLVRLHTIKEFDEPYDDAARGRIQALKPGYYTRMGAAIRFATRVMDERSNAIRLLLLLTDGKPNDIDHYEGRYAIEDTAAAVREAKRAGLRPFCVTIDDEAADYLPHIFGAQGFIVVQRPEDLPARLPSLYAQITAN